MALFILSVTQLEMVFCFPLHNRHLNHWQELCWMKSVYSQVESMRALLASACHLWWQPWVQPLRPWGTETNGKHAGMITHRCIKIYTCVQTSIYSDLGLGNQRPIREGSRANQWWNSYLRQTAEVAEITSSDTCVQFGALQILLHLQMNTVPLFWLDTFYICILKGSQQAHQIQTLDSEFSRKTAIN